MTSRGASLACIAQSATVLIRDTVDYILLAGSAVALADDLVATQLALAGPPDIFSGSWLPR
jgi:hypothetical protein